MGRKAQNNVTLLGGRRSRRPSHEPLLVVGVTGWRRDRSLPRPARPPGDRSWVTSFRCRNSELSADDLRTWQGVVLGRAVSTLRSVETQPSAWGFVSMCQTRPRMAAAPRPDSRPSTVRPLSPVKRRGRMRGRRTRLRSGVAAFFLSSTKVHFPAGHVRRLRFLASASKRTSVPLVDVSGETPKSRGAATPVRRRGFFFVLHQSALPGGKNRKKYRRIFSFNVTNCLSGCVTCHFSVLSP